MIKYRLLGVDLDGTLLTKFKKINKKDLQSLKDYHSAGGDFVLCTGRSINSCYEISRKINANIDTVQKFIIASCGSYIVNLSNNTTKEYFIPDEVVRKIHAQVLLTKKKVALWAYTKECVKQDAVYTTSHILNPIVKLFKSTKMLVLNSVVEDLASYKLNILSLSKRQIQSMRKWLEENLSNDIDIIYTNPRLLEIVPKGVNKQTAFAYVANALKVNQNQTAYIGDSTNDASVLRWAGLSVSVGTNKNLLNIANHHFHSHAKCVSKMINQYLIDSTTNINLVASDLDGTLFTEHTTIIPSTLFKIERFINEKNGFFTIATGRNINDCLLVLDEIKTQAKQNLFAIVCNGAAIYDISKQKCIFSKTIETSIINELLELFRKMFTSFDDKYFEIFPLYEEKEIFSKQLLNAYVSNVKAQKLFYAKTTPTIQERYWAQRNIKDAPPILDDSFKILKLIFCISNLEERARMMAALNKYNDVVNICTSSNANIEINAIHVSKGNGISTLCHYLSIPIKNTLCIGDSNNDISMLDLSPNSVTLKTAKENVRKTAKNVLDASASEIVGIAIDQFIFNNDNGK